MRTTVDLDYDTLIAAKEIARMENTSLGKVISRLVRQALTGNATAQAASSPATITLGSTATISGTLDGEVSPAVSGAAVTYTRDANGSWTCSVSAGGSGWKSSFVPSGCEEG